jgi:UDP-GlcNAc:undecaprenyl-phosphate GlcNAc-1-phosphate transferase
MVSLAVFGLLFFLRDNLPLLFISVALFAALFNFLFFNLAPRRKKMFMGDTGSLVVGYILSILAIALIADQPIQPESGYIPQNVAVFLLSVLVIPILDTLRIIVIRLTRGQKPWVADRNHLHHVLLDCGLSHIQATAALVGLQIKAIVIVILINDLGPIALHGYLLCLYLTYSVVFLILSKTTIQKSQAVKKLTWVLRTLLP